jgi:hypothetical protein
VTPVLAPAHAPAAGFPETTVVLLGVDSVVVGLPRTPTVWGCRTGHRVPNPIARADSLPNAAHSGSRIRKGGRSLTSRRVRRTESNSGLDPHRRRPARARSEKARGMGIPPGIASSESLMPFGPHPQTDTASRCNPAAARRGRGFDARAPLPSGNPSVGPRPHWPVGSEHARGPCRSRRKGARGAFHTFGRLPLESTSLRSGPRQEPRARGGAAVPFVRQTQTHEPRR